MAAKKSGLGRGLDSLFSGNGLEDLEMERDTATLRVIDLEPNREQPREHFDEEALAELTRSIAQHGVLQPILVRPLLTGGYQIVAGERRWRAARAAGLSEVPVLIRELSDQETMVLALIENLQREDLNPMEVAKGYHQLLETCGLSVEEAAERLQKPRSTVSNALRLLKLSPHVQDLLRDKQLSSGHAKALLALPADQMDAVADWMVDKGLSVREAERLVKRELAAAEALQPAPQDRPLRRDAYYDEVQIHLEEYTGRRIKVHTHGKAETGTLQIDFIDKEDLRAIVKQLEEYGSESRRTRAVQERIKALVGFNTHSTAGLPGDVPYNPNAEPRVASF